MHESQWRETYGHLRTWRQRNHHDVKLTIACLGIQVCILYASTQQINVECAWDALPQCMVTVLILKLRST